MWGSVGYPLSVPGQRTPSVGTYCTCTLRLTSASSHAQKARGQLSGAGSKGHLESEWFRAVILAALAILHMSTGCNFGTAPKRRAWALFCSLKKKKNYFLYVKPKLNLKWRHTHSLDRTRGRRGFPERMECPKRNFTHCDGEVHLVWNNTVVIGHSILGFTFVNSYHHRRPIRLISSSHSEHISGWGWPTIHYSLCYT